MQDLLKKLRINYSSLVMLSGVFDIPKDGTLKLHAKLLDGFFEGQNNQCFITNEERNKLREKTFLHLRLRELLREHSQKASMIVMSLPMPRLVSFYFVSSHHSHILIDFFLSERSISSTLHVLVGDADSRYAAILAGPRQPNFGIDLPLVNGLPR